MHAFARTPLAAPAAAPKDNTTTKTPNQEMPRGRHDNSTLAFESPSAQRGNARQEKRRLSNHQHASSTAAAPIPVPMHMDTTPNRAPVRRISYSNVATCRQPVHPRGCPRAIAPPLGFTLRGSNPSSCRVEQVRGRRNEKKLEDQINLRLQSRRRIVRAALVEGADEVFTKMGVVRESNSVLVWQRPCREIASPNNPGDCA